MYINTKYYEAYRETSGQAEELGAVVRWCGYFQCGPQYKLQRVAERYFIIYVLEGIGYITDEGGDQTELRPGDVIMYRPHRYQDISVSKSAPMTYAGLIFNGDFFDRFLKGSYLMAQQKISIGVNMELAMSFRNLIGDMIVLPEEQDDRILAKTLEIIAEMNQMIRVAYAQTDLSEYNCRRVEELAAYIRQNCSRKLSLGELSERTGLSKSWINVLFQRVYHTSPGRFQVRERLEQVKIMLADNSRSIGQISGSLGFNDQFYMSRLFKRYTGMSPKEYRDSLRNKH